MMDNDVDNNKVEPMLDIEAKLLSDRDGTYKKEVTDLLYSYEVEIKKILDSGVTPDEFNKYNSLMNAVISASKTIEVFWNNIHKLR